MLAEEPLSQTDGAICLSLATSPTKYNWDMDNLKRSGYLIRHIFPVKLHVHMLCTPQPGWFSPIATQLAQTVVNVLRYYFENLGHVQIHIQHRNATRYTVLSELLEEGIPRNAIPKDFGGEYTYEDVSLPLLQERIAWEQQVYFPSNIQDHISLKQSATEPEPHEEGTEEKEASWLYNNAPPPPSYAKSLKRSDEIPNPSNPKGSGAPEEPSDPVLVAEDEQQKSGVDEKPTREQLRAERLERRQKADVIRSRRKRERQRLEIENMKDESERLAHENEQLKTEQARLERLLKEVEDIVADLN